MTTIDHARAELLRQECAVFTRALLGSNPTPYVTARYVAAHDATPHLRESAGDALDALLIRAARQGPLSLRCADMYARFVRPRGTLRQKLVLFLAIVENAPGMHVKLNSAHEQSLARALLQIALVLAAGAGILVMALVRFAPAHLAVWSEETVRVERPRGVAHRAVQLVPARVLRQPVHHGQVDP